MFLFVSLNIRELTSLIRLALKSQRSARHCLCNAFACVPASRVLGLKECTKMPGESTFLSVYVDHRFPYHDYVRMYVSNSTFLIATKSHRG